MRLKIQPFHRPRASAQIHSDGGTGDEGADRSDARLKRKTQMCVTNTAATKMPHNGYARGAICVILDKEGVVSGDQPPKWHTNLFHGPIWSEVGMDVSDALPGLDLTYV